MNSSRIILYPSNWLYNAGVVGFLRVLEFGDKNKLNEVLNREPFYITEKDIIILKEKFWEYGWYYLVKQGEKENEFEKWKYSSKKKEGMEAKIFAKTVDALNSMSKVKIDKKITFKISPEKEPSKEMTDRLIKKFKMKPPFLIKWLIQIYFDELIEENKEVISEKELQLLPENLVELKEFLKEKSSEYEKRKEEILKIKFVSNKLYASFKNHPFFNPAEGFNIIRACILLDKYFTEIFCFLKNREVGTIKCKMCGNKFSHTVLETWLSEILQFTQQISSLMGSSFSETPNFFFFEQNDLYLCPLCSLIMFLHPFGLPIDQREFVNVPSIKALYYLNNLLLKLKKKETYKALNPNERLESLISEAVLNYEFLKGAWLLQNVEFVQIEKGAQPKVYTLPISRTSAELIVRGDVRKSLANLKGQITVVKKEKNPMKVYAQREGIKRFLTGGGGSLVDLAYFSLKNDFMESKSNQAKETAYNLTKLEKIKIDDKKERRFEMVENDLIEIWNKGQDLQKEKFDKNLQYELLSASLIEDKNRLLEYLSEIDRKNRLAGKLAPLCELITKKKNLNLREIILAFIAGYKSDRPIRYEDMTENPLEIFWKEGNEIGPKIEKDLASRIKKYVFRIASKIRIGDITGTIFEILKLYLLCEKPVPSFLSEIFRDGVDIEKFKLLSFSFISGFVGKDEKQTGDVVYEMQEIGRATIEESLDDRIKKYGYRMLSLIRAGQRIEFAYEVIKLFALKQESIPYKFIEVLDPAKSVAEFQSLAYGILSGYLEDIKT